MLTAFVSAAGRLDVVVLDQDAVAQVENVIVRATDANRILLQHPEARPALARVGDAHVGALDHVHIAPRLGRDPGQLLDPVQRTALDGKER